MSCHLYRDGKIVLAHSGPWTVVSSGFRTSHGNIITSNTSSRRYLPFPRHELSKLGVKERAGINAAFRERCKSEEGLSNGLHRVDYLGGRN